MRKVKKRRRGWEERGREVFRKLKERQFQHMKSLTKENLDKIKFDQKKIWTKEMRREESRESSMATASTAVRAMGSNKI